MSANARTVAPVLLAVTALCVPCTIRCDGGQKAQKSIELPADHRMADLKPGPGVEKARANCVACHSTDYIVRQPGSDEKHWAQEVRKMIEVFGAPISERDAREIVQYLARAYGPAPSIPRPQPRGPAVRPVAK